MEKPMDKELDSQTEVSSLKNEGVWKDTKEEVIWDNYWNREEWSNKENYRNDHNWNYNNSYNNPNYNPNNYQWNYNNNYNNGPRTTIVSVDTEKFSILLFLLCFFLPFISPMVAIFKKKFLLALWYLIVLVLIVFISLIPIIWIFIWIIMNIFLAISAWKLKSKTNVTVTA